ncbi:MAG TPA: NAD(P)-dependent oxidoreductase [Bdellovibrionota bacterium]|nr:NAD(P)-dependent oxidoreductase [Bdellovibrionota bacterium]
MKGESPVNIDQDRRKIGFLGLGIMGSAIARNLLKGGFEVTVWNRSPEKCEPLAEIGAHVVRSPCEAVERSFLTFAMLADPAAAESMLFNPDSAIREDGVLNGLSVGKGYIDLSTVDPATSRKIGAAVSARGARFLEAPVSGSKKPAEEGNLVILSAGDESLHQDALPCFEKMGKKIFYLGTLGNGARMKLIVNMVMGEMMIGLCEGLGLAQAAGLEQQDFLNVLDSGALANAMFRLKGPQIGAGQFSPAFPLKHMQKDLRLTLALADEIGVSLPSAAIANESFKKARQLGSSNEDFSAVYKALV